MSSVATDFAQPLSVQGDVQGLPMGSQIVTAIQGRTISVAAPSRDGQALAWDTSSNSWIPTNLISVVAPATAYGLEVGEAGDRVPRFGVIGEGQVDFSSNGSSVDSVISPVAGGLHIGNFTTPVSIGNGVQVLAGGGSILSAAGGVGYSTGAGSAVTQSTNKTTGVSISAICGVITMNNASLATTASVAFGVINTLVATTDVVVINAGPGFLGYRIEAYNVGGTVGASTGFSVRVTNITGGTLSEAVKINFAVIKAVSS